MKKAALFLLALLIILSLQTASMAADTRTQSGKATTVGHFRMFAPDGNDLESGRPLIVFFATSQQPKVDKVLGLVNTYGMYDDFDANIICMAIAGNYAQGKWPQAVKDLAPGLVVTARTEDGVVEAYESIAEASDPYGKPLGDRILAVQFHPETFTQAGNPTFLRIFQDLVRRARP